MSGERRERGRGIEREGKISMREVQEKGKRRKGRERGKEEERKRDRKMRKYI